MIKARVLILLNDNNIWNFKKKIKDLPAGTVSLYQYPQHQIKNLNEEIIKQ